MNSSTAHSATVSILVGLALGLISWGVSNNLNLASVVMGCGMFAGWFMGTDPPTRTKRA